MDTSTAPQGEHYRKGGIQPIEYISSNSLTFEEGNVVKYITRHRHKNKDNDVFKAIDYALYILQHEYGLLTVDILNKVSDMMSTHAIQD